MEVCITRNNWDILPRPRTALQDLRPRLAAKMSFGTYSQNAVIPDSGWLNIIQTMAVALWCSRYYYSTTSFHTAKTQVLRRFKPCLRRVWNSRWWESLTMFSVGNKAKRFWSANLLQKQFITIIFIIIIKDFVSIQSHSHCWCYHYLIMRVFCRVFLLKVRLCKRKNKLCMDFAPTKFPVNVLWSIFASNISLIIVCNVWIKCR